MAQDSPDPAGHLDRDGREIDFLFARDGTLYPLEVKKSATPNRRWAQAFGVLDRLGQTVGEGGVACLCRQTVPLSRSVAAIPVGLM